MKSCALPTNRLATLIGAMVVCLLTACDKPAEAPTAEKSTSRKPLVYVDNYPLAYFAERIVGPEATVVFPAPADGDPAFWQPGDADIARYQSADCILLNGATYSKWTTTTSLPEAKVVDTSAAFKDTLIQTDGGVTHSHGKSGEHSHAGTAFTTWIDFSQAIKQAEAVKDAMVRLLPDHAELLALNHDLLHKELLELDSRMLAVGRKLANQPLMASHPIYQYWARRYQLDVRAVLWEPEVVPDDKQMDELKKMLATKPAKWMVWEGEPAGESVEKLKTLGLGSVVFAPCGNVPEKDNWKSVMENNVKAMETLAGL